MGKVTVDFRATNYDDLLANTLKLRRRKTRAIRATGLVDTGAARLYLQSRVITKLGLRQVDRIKSRTISDRAEERRVFSPLKLEVRDRSGLFEVVELPDTLPNVIGQIPLEHMDWVVDPNRRRLIPNPEHRHGEMADDFGEAS